MFVITMHALFWNDSLGTFCEIPTLYADLAEAAEAAQENAKLNPESPWTVANTRLTHETH